MLKNLLYLIISIGIVIFSWIGFGIYHNYTTSTISSDTGILITPIPAKFDDKTLLDLATRKVVPADLGKTRAEATPGALIVATGSGAFATGSAGL